VTARFEPAALVTLRRELMGRGLVLSTLLADVLAGKRPPQLEDLISGTPGKRPEERVRGALDQVERRRKQLDAGDDNYGRCDSCGVDLGLAALREMPWADRCSAHTAE
jgi:hypothetical protein